MIYFVRHGQTDDNVNGILTGWLSTPLNDKGLSQAIDTAEQLKNVHFDICFCSPLKRTKQTLFEILKYHEDMPIIFDARLKERDYGSLTGKNTKLWQGERWHENNPLPEETESISDMYSRVESLYNDIFKKYKDKNVLIVSHSGVGRMSYFYFNGKPTDGDYSNFEIGNAKIMELDFNNLNKNI